MPYSSHLRLDHSNYTGQRVQVIKLFVTQFPPPLSLHPSSVQIFSSAVFKADVSHPILLHLVFLHLLMAYSKAKLKSSSDKASHCFRPFWIRKLSDKCLPIQTLLYVSFKHILISLSSFMDTQNSMRILNNTSLLTES
jgi:hypothetical protein